MRRSIPVTYLFFLNFLIASLSVQYSYGQQGNQFTQYMYDQSIINPAYVGADEALSLNLIHRDQWSGIDGAPQSQTLSAHSLFKRKKFGTGLLLHRETIGIHTQLDAAANFAYHLKTGVNSFLSFGIKAGITNRQSDYQSLERGTPDNVASFNNLNETYLDAGLGLFFRNRNLQIGYAVPQLLPPVYELGDTIKVNPTNLNHLLFTKYSFDLNESFKLIPSILLKYYKGTPFSYDLNINTTYYDIISAGVSYRKDESIDLLLKLHITPQLQIGYAYDIPIGEVGAITRSSSEIMLRYLFKFKYAKVVSPR
ncbi:type IX secretion system membrane protein PorP/SprF [Marivirga atlantica]|jgi:type IX secretion system PorP/SprF family membrane protein|uniref:Type IX secretion system membrane protein PorP/SprF n=1 Tax=Marivirga atlantica TaxID=1548457 RepID=A0A937A929_9BACT|nr:type IX secretion system membrane protein PorP/SprF [Marivirga atlantica]MBL0765865.1 type IX secretion system membrane protein PorP/SprF [Marivirga atlantica]